jgi:hypothetical protein
MLRIEEIDALRRQNGIDDVELRQEIAGLRVGDEVRLTFLAGPGLPAPQTLRARITHIGDGGFCGRLVDAPAGRAPPALRRGAAVSFTAGQIHSVVPPRRADEPGERPAKRRR